MQRSMQRRTLLQAVASPMLHALIPWVVSGVGLVRLVGRGSQGKGSLCHRTHCKAKVVHQPNGPMLVRVVELNVHRGRCLLLPAKGA